LLHVLALAGVLSISFSAVFVRLASVSPVTAGFYRALIAVPILVALRAWVRKRDTRSPAERALAFASGLFLGLDLALWHESIALIGVGLATVLPNVQVVCVALADYELPSIIGAEPERPAAVYAQTVAAAIVRERKIVLAQLARLGLVTIDATPADLSVLTMNKYLQLKREGRL
jgi:hypothetical protein